MSNLSTLNKTDLLKLAAARGLNFPANATKLELVARLSEVNTVTTDEVSGFAALTREELLAIAEEFAVEVNPHEDKAVIISTLDEYGVTYEFYKSMHPDPSDEEVLEPAVVTTTQTAAKTPAGEKVLLKMNRKNATFEIRGAKFTRENPFALVNESDVDYILDVVGGFEIARLSEVQKYYA
jgi:hypothetical protein